ncbi:tyrosine-protein phosphatase [Lysinibacillus sp. BW-2-10]|uniref:tyrosine-protein phosphatase n=1 Tax=Lysinibacillus sp. BW-2-10 TaxID=2590030 RepID=UPI0011814D2F|nr:CpsB/CapC family capsule biosynthesis tyrosine phosphatase [Lysinibacillus sp. BW-2-10]TSI11337.1 capsular biosynthesis protein [Lysinibacillus sp. BW-2-10]
MVDIHSHILWNVDDGPTTLNETLGMLEQAVKEGVKEIVATPHFQHPLYSVHKSDVQARMELLQIELDQNHIPLTIFPGHEVRLSHQIVSLYKEQQIHSLANSKYILIELPSNTVPLYTTMVIHQICGEGLVPIIAHPEKNKAIFEKPALLENLIRHRALAQITAGSIAGHYGRSIQKFSLELIEANFIHVYGSDAHNLKNRPFLFEKGLHILEKKKLFEHAAQFLANNESIISNHPITALEPQSIKKRKWW